MAPSTGPSPTTSGRTPARRRRRRPSDQPSAHPSSPFPRSRSPTLHPYPRRHGPDRRPSPPRPRSEARSARRRALRSVWPPSETLGQTAAAPRLPSDSRLTERDHHETGLLAGPPRIPHGTAGGPSPRGCGHRDRRLRPPRWGTEPPELPVRQGRRGPARREAGWSADRSRLRRCHLQCDRGLGGSVGRHGLLPTGRPARDLAGGHPREDGGGAAVAEAGPAHEGYNLGELMFTGFPAFNTIPPRSYDQRLVVLGYTPPADFEGFLQGTAPSGPNMISGHEEHFRCPTRRVSRSRPATRTCTP